MRAALLGIALAAALAGCQGSRLFSAYDEIEVREVARSLYCNSEGDQVQAGLLRDAQAVLDWQAARGITLAGAESLKQAPYALVEMGSRPTGGYSLAVARKAVLRGELVILQATFFAPQGAAPRTQAFTAPCVLVQLPPGRYSSVEVQEPEGAMRATGGVLQPAAPSVMTLPVAPPEAGPVETQGPSEPVSEEPAE